MLNGCLLKQFIAVFALNTPIKVVTDGDFVLYGRCYKDADHDTSFEVFSINELFDKYGEYIVIFSFIRDGILYIEIEDWS